MAKLSKADSISEAAVEFMAWVDACNYRQGPNPASVPLTNFTFWAGAGFSKSWDSRSPVGNELFTMSPDNLENVADTTVLSRLFGIDDDSLSPGDLRQIIYQLDMYERYPDVCSRYVDPQNIQIFRAGLRASVVQRYGEIAAINYFDASKSKFPLESVNDHQKSILEFFGYLHKCSDGSEFFAEGIRCHFATTNYDFVIETILDNIIAPDDSLFLYTYRGFTPERVVGISNPVPTHQHWLTGHLLKLNGGFEILRSGDKYHLDYNRRSRQEIMNQPPVLMLPSREQDYTDPYFKTIFPKAVRLMRDSRVLVLVGYSLPDDDALMRFVIRQFAEEPEDGRRKAIFYIDRLDRETKLDRLRTIFPSMKNLEVPVVFTYEGNFADFAAECMAQLKRY